MSRREEPPPAQGVRLAWQDIPESVRASVEVWLGSRVVNVESQPGGFSPGVAARLQAANGRRVFVKAIGPKPNPDSVQFHRREAQIAALIPDTAPVPRLLWWLDDASETGWVLLVFQDIEGRHPAQPWLADELQRVLDAMTTLSESLTPSPLPAGSVRSASDLFDTSICGWRRLRNSGTSGNAGLDAWSVRHLDELARIEETVGAAVAGDTLLHSDLRADNMLMTTEQVWFVDWPHASVGAAWVDVMAFAPSMAMQGGPDPEDLIQRHPACRQANPEAITAGIVSLAGFFTYQALQPPPPGLPTLRRFQDAQGIVARQWIARRTGWT